jgi:hypothetical protein
MSAGYGGTNTLLCIASTGVVLQSLRDLYTVLTRIQHFFMRRAMAL